MEVPPDWSLEARASNTHVTASSIWAAIGVPRCASCLCLRASAPSNPCMIFAHSLTAA